MTDRILIGMFACYVAIGRLERSDNRAQSAPACIAKN